MTSALCGSRRSRFGRSDPRPTAGPPDWSDPEPRPAPTATIAWLIWHICFWWTMVIDHTFDAAQLRREDVLWPGTAEAAVARIVELHEQWRAHLAQLAQESWSVPRKSWPWSVPRTPAQIEGWVNAELMKNTAEIGVLRRLFNHSAQPPA